MNVSKKLFLVFAMVMFSTIGFAAPTMDWNGDNCYEETINLVPNYLTDGGGKGDDPFADRDCESCRASVFNLNAFKLNSCKYGFSASSSITHPCTRTGYEFIICQTYAPFNLQVVSTPNNFLLFDFAGWGTGDVHVWVRMTFTDANGFPCTSELSNEVQINLPGC